MTQRGQGCGPDVVDRDIESSVEQGEDLAGRDECLGASRRRAVADVLADEAGRPGLIGVGRRENADGVGRDMGGDRDGPGTCLLYTSPSPRD